MKAAARFSAPLRALGAVLLVAASGLLAACEEVIDYDLTTGQPQLVIEGLVTDQPGPYTVRLTTTAGYLDQNAVPTADADLVTITDATTALTDTLRRTAPGVYQTTAGFPAGQIGHTYHLLVRRAGKDYTADTELRRSLPFDSISFQYKTPKTDLVSDSGYYATLYFQEPAGRGDYYRFMVYQNRTWRNRDEIVVIDDAFYDGNYGDPEIGYDFQPGDTVTVEMRSIDKPVFDYFNALALVQANQGGPFDSPPANAPTNIRGGAIGFFSASQIHRITGITPRR